MIIPCREIVSQITESLKEKVLLLKEKREAPKLLAVLAGDQPEQRSYVQIKHKIARDLGIEFEFLDFPNPPPFQEFLSQIKTKAAQQDISGVILQLPLPQEYDYAELYRSIPSHKDIEGHNPGSVFVFPLVQACMIGLDWVYRASIQDTTNYSLPFLTSDTLVTWLQSKHITIAGRGITTGKQIASYFDKLGVPYSQTNSTTVNPDPTYRQSDIIICGAGKKILSRDNITQGVILLNFGLHTEVGKETQTHKKRLLGDYDEDEIKNIASWYSITPGGLGPIDILCLYGNLIESVTHGLETRNMKLDLDL